MRPNVRRRPSAESLQGPEQVAPVDGRESVVVPWPQGQDGEGSVGVLGVRSEVPASERNHGVPKDGALGGRSVHDRLDLPREVRAPRVGEVELVAIELLAADGLVGGEQLLQAQRAVRRGALDAEGVADNVRDRDCPPRPSPRRACCSRSRRRRRAGSRPGAARRRAGTRSRASPRCPRAGRPTSRSPGARRGRRAL